MDINSITVSGTVTRPPQMKTTQTGKNFAKFSMQVEKAFGGKSFFIDVDIWGKDADITMQNVRQNDKVIVSGRLDVNAYTDTQTQQKKTATSITAENIVTLSQLQQKTAPQQSYGVNNGYAQPPQYQQQYQPQQQIPQTQYNAMQYGYTHQPNSWSNAQPVNSDYAPALFTTPANNPSPTQAPSSTQQAYTDSSSEQTPQPPNADIPF